MCLTIEGDPDFMAIVTSVEPDAVTIRLLRDYRTRLKVWGIHARNAEQNMALNLLTDPEIDFVTLLGQAGTGKTLMTLAAALTQTIDERRFSEIIVTRATVSVGEDIGFPARHRRGEDGAVDGERSRTTSRCFTARKTARAATGVGRRRSTSSRPASASSR